MNQLWKFRRGATALAFGTASSIAAAQNNSSFGNVSGNGQTAGKISQNIASGFAAGVSGLEAFLYIASVVFLVLFIMGMVKWKKTDGREGSMGLLAIYLLASVFAFAAPTLLGGGISTIFGTGTVTTIKPPTTTTIGN